MGSAALGDGSTELLIAQRDSFLNDHVVFDQDVFGGLAGAVSANTVDLEAQTKPKPKTAAPRWA